MLIQALLLGLLAGICILDGRIFGQTMLDRPIVTGALVGLILGDLKSGIMIGASLELIWMGIVGIGSATPPDMVTGGILGTAFAIISGRGPEVALTLAVPIAMLAQTLGILCRIINTSFIHRADRYAAEGNARMVTMMHWIPAILFFLSTAVPTFLAVSLGSDAVKLLLNSIPQTIIDGLKVASAILPALGFALLMNMIISKKLAPFYFLGFLTAAYFKLDIVAIALFGLILAIVITQLTGNKESTGEV